MQKQRWGVFSAILAALYLLNKLRKRRKLKKQIKKRARARARMEEMRRKEEGAKKKAGKRVVKKAKKKKSLIQQLVRFTIFQILRKLISEQIKQTEIDLGRGKLGKKLVGAVEE